MKKVIVTVLALALAFGVTACSSQKKTEPEPELPMAGMPNPVMEKESLEEINEAAGTKLVHPPVMGATDEVFIVINSDPVIAEYHITINGVPYLCRAARTEEDITGVYLDEGTLGEKVADGESTNAGGYSITKWFADGVQYVIYTEDEDGSVLSLVETFADEMKSMQ